MVSRVLDPCWHQGHTNPPKGSRSQRRPCSQNPSDEGEDKLPGVGISTDKWVLARVHTALQVTFEPSVPKVCYF